MIPRLHQLLRYSLWALLPLFVVTRLLNYWFISNSAMPARPGPDEVASSLLVEKRLQLQSSERIQSLWAGYGQIARIFAVSDKPTNPESYILKLVTPPSARADDEGHIRKMLSYQVEQYFYSELARQMPTYIPVATCLKSIHKRNSDGASITAMILTDLKQVYPVAGEKRDALSPTQAKAALNWLSNFHGFWWSRVEEMNRSSLVLPPLEEAKRNLGDTVDKTVWLNGGYTYLATRRKEYGGLVNDVKSEWSKYLTLPIGDHKLSIAEMVAAFLAPKPSGSTAISGYQTLIHGDVKSENLFSSTSGEDVVFYDFQYVGIGLGVCDLAKFFTCSVPLSMLATDSKLARELGMQSGEKQLLSMYWKQLAKESGKSYEWDTFVRHWEIGLVDWLRFQASWGFWGNTEWLEARVRSILNDQGWRKFLYDSVAITDEKMPK